MTSQTRKLDFAPPSKPEKPPPQPQAEVTAQEDDDDTDLQAAWRESLKAPSTPQPESGAQSSTPKPVVDLDKQETELLAQLDRLMEESVRLESLPNPTVRDRSRIRSIATVSDDIEQKIKEIDAQKQAQSSLKMGKTSQVSRVSTTPMEVRPAAPPSMQPLTLDNLMAGVTQPVKALPTPAVSPEAQLLTIMGHDQPRASTQSMPIEDHPQPPQPPSPVQPQPPVISQEASEPPPPAIEDKPKQERKEVVEKEVVEEPLKERERTPTSEPSHSRRRHSPAPPSHDREVTPDSSKVRSKESKKAEKRRKKESKRRRRSESDDPRCDRTRREERSRSTRRPESPIEQRPQVAQIEASETDDPPVEGESQLAIRDKPPRARPRFDPTKEHVVAQRIADKKRIVVQPPREHRRDPSTEGSPDCEEERRMKRRPPLPPPATSTRQASSGHKPLSFVRPPPQRTGSASESSFVPSERGPLRLRVRVEDTPLQRQMPRRALATPIGSSAPPRLESTSHRDKHRENIRLNPK